RHRFICRNNPLDDDPCVRPAHGSPGGPLKWPSHDLGRLRHGSRVSAPDVGQHNDLHDVITGRQVTVEDLLPDWVHVGIYAAHPRDDLCPALDHDVTTWPDRLSHVRDVNVVATLVIDDHRIL